jgi:hypothetical protein
VVPVRFPSDTAPLPSPNTMSTAEIGGLPAATLVVTVKVAADPAVAPTGATMDIVGAVLMATSTVPPIGAAPPRKVAVTVAATVLVKMLRAVPAESVTESNTLRLPPVVVRATDTPTRRLPARSITVALIVEAPPVDGSSAGVAVTVMVSAAAAPITSGSPPSPTLWAPPENARTVAIPDSVPACSVTTACPLLVLASCGSRRPRSVVNVTNVPLWTEVPLSSTMLARISRCH